MIIILYYSDNVEFLCKFCVYCILGNIVRKANKGLNIIILERCIRDKRGDRHQKIKERLQHIDKMKALIHFVWGGGAAGGRGATA